MMPVKGLSGFPSFTAWSISGIKVKTLKFEIKFSLCSSFFLKSLMENFFQLLKQVEMDVHILYMQDSFQLIRDARSKMGKQALVGHSL